jgi:type II secretory pathway component PulC
VVIRKYLLKNVSILNGMLLIFALLMANYSVSPFMGTSIRYVPPSLKESVPTGKEKSSEYNSPSLADYVIVAEQNLFHPERKIPAEKKDEQQSLPKPEIVLYGTVISENARLAYIEDLKAPQSTAGRGKRQIVLKEGDTMGGFTLKEIEPDKIVMVRGEEKIIFRVHDTQRVKSKEVSQEAHGRSGQSPTQTPQVSSAPKPLSTDSLVHRSFPTTRAPMGQSEEAARQFFTK